MSKNAQAIQSNFERMQNACDVDRIKRASRKALQLRDEKNNQSKKVMHHIDDSSLTLSISLYRHKAKIHLCHCCTRQISCWCARADMACVGKPPLPSRQSLVCIGQTSARILGSGKGEINHRHWSSIPSDSKTVGCSERIWASDHTKIHTLPSSIWADNRGMNTTHVSTAAHSYWYQVYSIWQRSSWLLCCWMTNRTHNLSTSCSRWDPTSFAIFCNIIPKRQTAPTIESRINWERCPWSSSEH